MEANSSQFPAHRFEPRSTSLLGMEIFRWGAGRDCRFVQQRRGFKVNRMGTYRKLATYSRQPLGTSWRGFLAADYAESALM